MTLIGYTMVCEQAGPKQLVRETSDRTSERLVRSRLSEPGGPHGMLSHAPAPWNRRPIRKPTAAAPSPITTIFSPFFRQSPTRVSDE